METHINFDPDAKVSGIGIQVILYACESQGLDITDYLEQHGLTNIQPNDWLPFATILDLMHETRVRQGNFMGLIAIGNAVPQFIPLPPGIETFEDIILNINKTYGTVHQGDVGYYEVEQVAPRHLRVKAYTPYPSDFEYGLMYGHARRSLPHTADVLINRSFFPSRMRGDDHCVFDITWQLHGKNLGRMPGRLSH